MENIEKNKKPGRPKKYNNLKLISIYVEDEVLTSLQEILTLSIELHGTKEVTLSSILRELIEVSTPLKLKRVKECLEKKRKLAPIENVINQEDFHQNEFNEVEEIHQVIEDVDEKNHKEEVQESSYVMDNTQEVLQEINSKQDTQWGNNPFNV